MRTFRLCRKHPLLLTFAGVFAVPAEKGKLEKISFRLSSRCDRGAREDFLQEIFELTPATVAHRKRSSDSFLESVLPSGTTDIPLNHTYRKPVRHYPPLTMCDQGFQQNRHFSYLPQRKTVSGDIMVRGCPRCRDSGASRTVKTVLSESFFQPALKGSLLQMRKIVTVS